MRRVNEPDNPKIECNDPLTTASPPKTAEPVLVVVRDPVVPLTKKKTSVPISDAASGAAGEDWPPTKDVDPVVKIEPAVVLSKKIGPPSLLPPPEDAMVT